MKNSFIRMCFTFVAALIAFSCSNDSSNTNQLQEKNLNLKILNTPYEYYNYAFSDYSLEYFNIDKQITSNSLVLDGGFEPMIKNIIEFYGIDQKQEDYRSIIFYGENLDLDLGFSMSGFSTVIQNTQGFYMETYKIEGNKTILIDEISRQFNNVIFSEVLGYYSHKLNNTNNSFLAIYNSKSPNKQFNLKSGEEENNNEYAFDLELLDQYPTIVATSNHYCTTGECSSTNSGFCEHLSTSTPNPKCKQSSYVTDNRPCADEDSGENPSPGGGEEDPDYSFVQKAKTAMYEVRDNILSTTTKGKQYVDYYYKISYVWRVTGTTETNKDELRDLMGFIRNKAILFTVSDNSTVIVNTSEANYIRPLITKYKSVNNNAEYQFIFSTLETDLNNLENKTKGDYLNYIQ